MKTTKNISDFIQNPQHFNSIELKSVKIDEGEARGFLQAVKDSSLGYISLEKVEFYNPRHKMSFWSKLYSINTLKTLHITNNNLNDEDAEIIISSFIQAYKDEVRTGRANISLSNNKITDKGLGTLKKLFSDSSSGYKNTKLQFDLSNNYISQDLINKFEQAYEDGICDVICETNKSPKEIEEFQKKLEEKNLQELTATNIKDFVQNSDKFEILHLKDIKLPGVVARNIAKKAQQDSSKLKSIILENVSFEGDGYNEISQLKNISIETRNIEPKEDKIDVSAVINYLQDHLSKGESLKDFLSPGQLDAVNHLLDEFSGSDLLGDSADSNHA